MEAGAPASEQVGGDAATPEPTVSAERRRARRERVLRILETYGLLIGLLLTIALFSFLLPDLYFTRANAASVLGSQAVLAVLTLALIIPLSVSEFDLSVAGVLTLSAMSLAILDVDMGVPIGWAILIALLIGVVAGFVNGIFAVGFGVNSLIVTLGTGTFLAGIVFWISDSRTITGIDSVLVRWVTVQRLAGIPYQFFYALILAAVIWYVFDFTPLGQRMVFTGQNEAVARLAGVNTKRIRWLSLMTSGVLAALAGVLFAGTTGSADPSSGNSLLLPAFAAAFLGATSVRPGRFNPWGTILAVYFLIAGITGLQLLGAQSFIQRIFYGAALVLAVTLAKLSSSRRE